MTVVPLGRKLAAAVLPRTHRGRVLSLGATMDAVATGMFLAAATLYFVGIVGISVIDVGIVLSVANLCGLASPLPLGWVADRVGARTVYLVLLFVRAAGYLGYIFVDGFAGYLVLTCVLTAASRACTPLLQVIVGEFEGEQDRTQTMASLRSVSNIGLTVGFLMAGIVQATGSRLAFAGLFVFIGLSFVGVAAATVRAARIRTPPTPAGTRTQAPGVSEQPVTPALDDGRSPYRDTRFIAFTLANAVLMLHDSILFILVPLWVVQRAGLPATVSSVLLSINTVLTVIVQVYLGRSRHGVARSRRLLRFACAALVAACGLFAATDHRSAAVVVVGVTAAVVLLTIGENLHAVAGWELSYRMSTPAARTQYLSLFSLSTTAQMIVGPVLITTVILPGASAGWVLLAVGFVAATALAVLTVRGLTDPPAVPHVSSRRVSEVS
ncbi:MFS transporter [Actinoplanes sp. NPDC051346]|uniref:MFS transporter n=1 Tax=Actinoplanes sp. NPDC051346 TaxID=3155048 RepID=UPI00342F754C